ncbi:spore protease YyaC [Ornithinibacillus halotolerans]|uniref:Spore protease YyaC n=1 Tax=Ornithinibacillus halotolerans TaxID=1274357 RepID=A0A916W668_9BACI|nr:spore protease YyaC [Ornithinibacillus halotolerans]GGA70327.1 spore protease YyaC [Ornithinibacillus halotolerans]
MNLKSRLTQKNNMIRMLHTDSSLAEMMGEQVLSWFPTSPKEYVVVCVGTDRSTGDALGPLTGSYLQEKKLKHMTVYGTLSDPVHATNLEENIHLINKQHKNAFIIAIDACLGKTSSVGQIIACEGALKPGAALNKPLPSIGDIHITGVVNISGFMEYSVLQNTRLSIVVEMAKKIADLLETIDKQLSASFVAPAVVSPKVRRKPI